MSEEITDQEGIVLNEEQQYLQTRLRMMREARMREQLEIEQSLKPQEQE